VEKALVAPSAWWKVTWAMPRLFPPGPYDNSTFLTWPTDDWKYSYRGGCVVSVMWFERQFPRSECFDIQNPGH